MNKTELIAAVAEKSALSKKDAEKAVAAVLSTITETLKAGEKVFEPTLADVRGYVDKLYGNIKSLNSNIRHKDSRLKKFLNFVAVGVDPEGRFLGDMRRAQGIDQLLKVCDAHLLGSNADKKFNCGGYKTLVARPNHED